MSCAKGLFVLIIYNAVLILRSSDTCNPQQAPIPADFFTEEEIPPGKRISCYPKVRDKIVFYHNYFRKSVCPRASNMLEMTWHPFAAEQAQRYADRCEFLRHSTSSAKSMRKLVQCGENLYGASLRPTWSTVVRNWFMEYMDFQYGVPKKDNGRPVGHYIQMVWATSHRLGCGLAHCHGGAWGHFYNFVCHYCPVGNLQNISQYPYKLGTPCGDCPNSCVNGSLCTNSCAWDDAYNNCADIKLTNPDLCNWSNGCNATCQCGNTKIYRNYPFD